LHRAEKLAEIVGVRGLRAKKAIPRRVVHRFAPRHLRSRGLRAKKAIPRRVCTGLHLATYEEKSAERGTAECGGRELCTGLHLSSGESSARATLTSELCTGLHLSGESCIELHLATESPQSAAPRSAVEEGRAASCTPLRVERARPSPLRNVLRETCWRNRFE
jgi:hypothetical protein